MLFRISRIFLLATFLVIVFVGWRGYHYFFDKHFPSLIITGIEPDGYYSGDIQCFVTGSDTYKVADIGLWLDGASLLNNTRYKVNAATFEYPFSIPTKALSNGRHVLKSEVMNGTYCQSKTIQEITFHVDNIPLQAALVKGEAEYKVFQGRTLHVQFQVNKEIKSAQAAVLSQIYSCFPESKNALIYECFIPISCEEVPNEYILNIEICDNVGNVVNLEAKFQIILFPFKKQVLRLNPEKIQQEKEIGLSERALEVDIESVTKASPQKKLWQGSFCPPIDIKSISTEYGTIRTTQERGRYLHKAVDVLDTPRAVVWATQDGVIALKNRYAHSGNTVVIDHGYGIISLFFHLENFADIAVGHAIKRGNPIGTLGMTGYASGYHLHWEMRIDNIHVDPLQWIKPNF